MAEAKKFKWNDVHKEKLSDTFSRQMIYGDRIMVAQLDIKKGSVVPEHSHENEQVSWIMKGELPHTKAMRLPDSWTMFTLTYGFMFNPSRAEASISTGVNSLKRSIGTFILYFFSSLFILLYLFFNSSFIFIMP